MIVRNLFFSYADRAIFKDLNMDVSDNKVTCIMGASGCGKTTLLNCICGRLSYTGNIEFGDTKAKSADGKLKVSYVFQQPRLIPSLSVEKNIEYVLPASMDREEKAKKVDEAVAAMDLEDCRKSYPERISGGQAGRTSLARAFAADGKLILMDEPFKGLDVRLKTEILNKVSPMLEERTVIFVTHDVEEALLVADRVYVMDRGEDGCGKIVGRVELNESRAERNIYSPRLNEARKQIMEMLT